MKPELLSPAGNFESVIAAVQNGADAVYLGGIMFNARQYASNFDALGLQKALDYAHIRNVKIYLTLNTLLKDNELYPALEYANEAYSMGIDAVIVQDFGFSKILSEQIPALPLHASTQMTIYNKEGVNLLLKNSFERIVLSRELSIEEIASIKKETNAELEVFMHGALCVCYSGQCFLSSAIGNSSRRSGNRGTCAQPCRLKYKLVSEGGQTEDEGHLLSTRDICSIDFLAQLINIGIDSFKIEGRMKSPEYVGIVTSKYRKAIDFIITDADKKDLLQIFNRGGFSKGYFYGKNPKETVFKDKPKNMGIPLGTLVSYNAGTQTAAVKLSASINQGDGIEILTEGENLPGGIVTGILVNKEFVKEAHAGETAELSRIRCTSNIKLRSGLPVIKTSSRLLNEAVSQTYKETANIKKTPVNIDLIFQERTPVEITLYSPCHNISYNIKTGILPEPARVSEISRERLISQISKTDACPFYINSFEISFMSGLFVPISEINNLRRLAFGGLTTEIINSYKKQPYTLNKFANKLPTVSTRPGITLSALFYNYKHLLAQPETLIKQIDCIILPAEYFSNQNISYLKGLKNNGISLTAMLPAIFKNGEIDMDRLSLDLIDDFIVGNIGAIDMIKRYGKPVCANIGLNVYNSQTAKELELLGINRFSLSPEMDIRDMPCNPNGEIIVYGKFPVITSEFCPVGGRFGSYPCKGSQSQYFLKDKMGEKYPVLCHNISCRPEILSSKPINLKSSLNELKKMGYRSFRINIFDESADGLEDIICQIKK